MKRKKNNSTQKKSIFDYLFNIYVHCMKINCNFSKCNNDRITFSLSFDQYCLQLQDDRFVSYEYRGINNVVGDKNACFEKFRIGKYSNRKVGGTTSL